MFIEENSFENVVCKMAAMLPRPQSVKAVLRMLFAFTVALTIFHINLCLFMFLYIAHVLLIKLVYYATYSVLSYSMHVVSILSNWVYVDITVEYIIHNNVQWVLSTS